MKTALVIDFLMQRGGAEWLLEVMHSSLFPEADIFTLLYRPEATREYFRDKRIITPPVLQKLPFVERHWRKYLPLFPCALKQLDFTGYDLIVSVSFLFVKAIVPPPGTKHICYCLTPMRQAWDPDKRGEYRLLSVPVWAWLRRWDVATASHPDAYIAISDTVARRIRERYGREAPVVYPPADTEFFKPAGGGNTGEEYYLIVSRLVPYKRVDLAVEAFNRLGLPLRIVGTGREERRLKAMARGNIRFYGETGRTDLKSLYDNCRAVICPQEEDFGIVAAEAQACGKPVIGYARGGIAEIVRDPGTGVLFGEQSAGALADAVVRSGRMKFDSRAIADAAVSRFSLERFRGRLREVVDASLSSSGRI